MRSSHRSSGSHKVRSGKFGAVKQTDTASTTGSRIELSSENNMSELMTGSPCDTSPDDLPNLYLHLYSPSLISQIFKSSTWARLSPPTSIITVIPSTWPGNLSIWTEFHRSESKYQIYTRTDYEDIMLNRGFLVFNFDTRNDTSGRGKRGRV